MSEDEKRTAAIYERAKGFDLDSSGEGYTDWRDRTSDNGLVADELWRDFAPGDWHAHQAFETMKPWRAVDFHPVQLVWALTNLPLLATVDALVTEFWSRYEQWGHLEPGPREPVWLLNGIVNNTLLKVYDHFERLDTRKHSSLLSGESNTIECETVVLRDALEAFLSCTKNTKLRNVYDPIASLQQSGVGVSLIKETRRVGEVHLLLYPPKAIYFASARR